eukprot:scaffold184603_cov15-Tisochrysis_lutea.AAC.1
MEGHQGSSDKNAHFFKTLNTRKQKTVKRHEGQQAQDSNYGAYQAHDFLGGQQALVRSQRNAFGWHAVLAAQIALLCQGDAQVGMHAAARKKHGKVQGE